MTTELANAPMLRGYLVLIRKRKWWIAIFALLGLAAGIVLSLAQPKEYAATAQLLVQPSAANIALGAAPAQITPTVVQTDVELVTSAPVRQVVARSIGGVVAAASAAEVAQTNVISVTAISSTPARAARIANAYSRAFVSYQQDAALRALAAAESQLRKQIRSLGHEITVLSGQPGNSDQMTARRDELAVQRQQLAQMQVDGAAANKGGIEFVTPAQPPMSPSSPLPLQNAMLGAAVGLILGLALAFIRDNFDDTVASKESAERACGAPVLALIPTVASWKQRDQAIVVSASQPLSPAAEAFRSLRTSLQFIQHDHELRTLLVTSPAAAEGKTSTVANIGAMFAQAGERVLLLSCDLRRPRLGKFFGQDERTGLTGVLRREVQAEVAIRQVSGQDNLWMLGAGEIALNPAELLSRPDAAALFGRLRDHFDLVLIDSPPVLPVTDAAVLSRYADGILIVVAAGQTKRVDLQRTAEKLSQVNAEVLGLVLNEVTRQRGYDYGYGYGYGYPPLATHSS